jgi:hypothetical protein
LAKRQTNVAGWSSHWPGSLVNFRNFGKERVSRGLAKGRNPPHPSPTPDNGPR